MGLIGNFSISATPRLNRFRDDGLAATIIDMDVPNDLFAAPAQLRQRLDLSGERTHQLDREISKSSFGRCVRVCRRRTKRLHRRSEEHTSELQSLMRTSYAVFCLKKKRNSTTQQRHEINNIKQE